MKTRFAIPLAAAARQRIAPKRLAVALAGVGMLSLAPCGFAADTDAADTAPTRIVVTGVRAAAASAQAIKKNADQVIDSIVADDIGKFPDTNVAQTIAHVTGVQVVHDAGEAHGVLIRGLPGIATLINGREMFSTTGRYIQLQDIPSAMLQRVDVYKSESANLPEGGIAGVVDVRTNRPFDFKGLQAAVNLGLTNKDKAGRTDPQLNGMVSNRWKTALGEFGALFGASRVNDHYFEERVYSAQPIDKSWLLPKLTGPDLVGILPIFGKRKRTGENFALQWRPNRQVEVFAEGLNSRYQNASETDFLVGLPWWSDGATMKASKIPGTNELDTLSAHNANTILSTQASQNETRASQYAVGARWQATPALRVNTELARTNSKYLWKNPILDTLVNVPDVFLKTNQADGAFLQYSGMDMSSGKNVNLFQLFDRYGHDAGSSTDWRADATYTPDGEGLFKEFTVGARLNRRYAESIKSFEGSTMGPGYVGNWDATKTVSAGSIPGLSCTAPATSVNYGTMGWFTPCSSYLLNNTGALRQLMTGSATARAIDPGSFFSDTEKNAAIYGQTKIGFSVAGIPVDALLGVRVTKTDADLVGKSQVKGAYVDTLKGASGTDVLPSASFKASLRGDLIARLAYAKTLTRPDFGQLNPGTAYVFANGTTIKNSASGGNPDLKPFTGQNVDASLEWYFAPTSLLSGTVFRHNFDGYIANKSVPEVFQGVDFSTSRPFNTDKGHLQGFELDYRQFFERLPGWLGGLGMEANYTFTEGGMTSSQDPNLQGRMFGGLSKNSYNLVALYEKGPFSGRLAYNWRSKFVGTYALGKGPDNAGDLIVAPMEWLDASLSYQLAKNLSVSVNGTNLLNFKYRDYFDDPAIYPSHVRRYDRTLGLMLSWKTK